jgi:WhiB family transcriptional regulator, redox-sensing transcriptional regulator
MNWRDSASCLSVPAELFFPEPQGASAVPALRVCGTCEVRAECLTEHMDEQDGIYGGTTPNDRVRLREAARKAGRKTQRRRCA